MANQQAAHEARDMTTMCQVHPPTRRMPINALRSHKLQQSDQHPSRHLKPVIAHLTPKVQNFRTQHSFCFVLVASASVPLEACYSQFVFGAGHELTRKQDEPSKPQSFQGLWNTRANRGIKCAPGALVLQQEPLRSLNAARCRLAPFSCNS